MPLTFGKLYLFVQEWCITGEHVPGSSLARAASHRSSACTLNCNAWRAVFCQEALTKAAFLSPRMSRAFHIEAARFLARTGTSGRLPREICLPHFSVALICLADANADLVLPRYVSTALPFPYQRSCKQLHSKSWGRRELVHQALMLGMSCASNRVEDWVAPAQERLEADVPRCFPAVIVFREPGKKSSMVFRCLAGWRVVAGVGPASPYHCASVRQRAA